MTTAWTISEHAFPMQCLCFTLWLMTVQSSGVLETLNSSQIYWNTKGSMWYKAGSSHFVSLAVCASSFWLKYRNKNTSLQSETHQCHPRGRWRNGRAHSDRSSIAQLALHKTSPDGSVWIPQTCHQRWSRESDCQLLLTHKKTHLLSRTFSCQVLMFKHAPV